MRDIPVTIGDDTYRNARGWASARFRSPVSPWIALIPRVLSTRHLRKSKNLHAFFGLYDCAGKNNRPGIRSLPR
jgi:hypothetical protein